MDPLLEKIYGLSPSERKTAKHVMLGGGTPGPTLFKGKGVRIEDVEGNSYIDCTSQSWAMYLGFSHPEITGVIKDHCENLTHIHQGFPHPDALICRKEISRICPEGFNRVSFTPGGGPSIESAMKVALLNRPGAHAMFSQYDSYHGTTFGSGAASWHSTFAAGKYVGGSHFLAMQPHMYKFPNPYLLRLPIPGHHEHPDVACAEVLHTMMTRGINGPPAGVIVEPIQASAGQIPATTAYLQRVREICDEFGAILIFDEIQTMGRMGSWTASEYFGVSPDVIVMGKGLGGGLPLSCIIVHDRVQGLGNDVQELHTFASPTLSHVTSAKMLEIMRRDNILENARNMGGYIADRVRALQADFPEIAEVRQIGLHIGVEFAKPDKDLTPLADECVKVRAEALKRNVIFGLGGVRKQVLKIKPPLIVNKNEADEIMEVFTDAVSEVFKKAAVAV